MDEDFPVPVPGFPGQPEKEPKKVSDNDLHMAFAGLLIFTPEMNHEAYGELRKWRGIADPDAL